LLPKDLDVRYEKTPTKEKDPKTTLLWAFLICYTVTQTSYLNVVSLLPIYIKTNFAETFSDADVGFLLASY
jgi:nitrate/nitrite transporter NarK